VTWWVWIIVAAGVVLVVWLAFVAIGTPGRRRAAQREEAAELRREAEEKLASAAQREVTAAQEAAAAERERGAAERAMEQADVVDPDLPDAPQGRTSTQDEPLT
jgi:flagellar biosynthesis/type III secretory pathway M-ring protein FliF/YscJ